MRNLIRPSIRILSGTVGLAFAILGVFLIANYPRDWEPFLLIVGVGAAFLLPAMLSSAPPDGMTGREVNAKARRLGGAIQLVRRAAVILCVLILGATVVSVVVAIRGTLARRDPIGTSAEEAYRALIADPIPAAVSDLQGGGTTWQGYNILLRFRAPSLERAGFTQPPYLQADCAWFHSDLIAPSLDQWPFIPKWKIPEAGNPVCLQWNELSNDWTTLGNHSALYVEGWVFFMGGGS